MQTGLTEVDLARFTGREIDYFDSFVMESIDQAGDLFEIATDLTVFPTQGIDGRIARRGVLAMAEAIYEGNAYRDLRASPFRTETIGTYTYALAESNVLSGVPSGVAWFDIAVERLRADTGSSISGSSISAFDRPGDVIDLDGRPVLIGPADTEDFVQGREDRRGAQGR